VIFGSVCSGIEAASVAWGPLGWRAAFLSEIDAFPRAVLRHRHPDTPLHGDFTTIEAGDHGSIDVLVGGTPCQDFSIAGLRAGMAGDRGNLTLQYLALARRLRPEWVVWENVPGVLSSNGGRDFGSFLGGLGELGYGWAYRTLDAQYAGIPQRRRRVFVVGHLGDWRRAAAVLFERHSLSGDPPPRREAGEGIAALFEEGARTGESTDDLVVGPLQSGGTPRGHGTAGVNRQAVNAGHVVAFNLRGREGGAMPETDDLASLRAASGGSSRSYVADIAVRRLTPREGERLQGFPDDYTLVPYRGKPAFDGPRYKALGNSMAVPVMRWIGERVDAVSAAVARVGAFQQKLVATR
jgi:DNA (cytosine-5)-methyltransferase 1